MKVQWYVVLAIAVSLICNQSSFADSKSDAETKVQSTNSKQALLDSMEDPIANRTFHKIQLKLLQTSTDSRVYDYFNSESVFQPLYNFLVQNNDALLSQREMTFKSSMVQAVRGMTNQYDLLDKLVVDVASSLGFSRETIKNRQIYIAGGEENAFTVSGSQNKILVVFQRGILRKIRDADKNTIGMIRTEIAGVLAHELGHIRAEHTVKGIMNYIALEIIGELFTSGKLTIMAQPEELNKALKQHTCEGVCVHSKDFLSKLGAQKADASIFFQSEKMGFIDQKIQEFVMQVASMPKPQLQSVLAGYMQMAIQSAKNERAPIQTIQYFETLLQNIGNIGTFRVNIEEYKAHSTMMHFAFSRAQESTADQISASTTRQEHIASAFSKLLGLDFDKESRPKIFEQIKRQAEEILAKVPAEQLSNYVGTTHPSLAIRINNMLKYPAYPSILFANNFLRLLLLNDALISAEAKAKSSVERMVVAEAYAKEQTEIILKTLADQGAKPEEIAQIRADAEKEIAQLNADLLKSEKEVTQSRKNHEARVLGLLFAENFPATAERSPRMDNTIQYFSLQREIVYIAADKIRKQILSIEQAKPSNELEANQLNALKEALEGALSSAKKTLDLQKEMIDRIKIRLLQESEKTNNSKAKDHLMKRYYLLSRIQGASSSAQLEEIRKRVTGVNPKLREQTEYRRNKIPVSLNTGAEVISPFAKKAKGGGTCTLLFK